MNNYRLRGSRRHASAVTGRRARSGSISGVRRRRSSLGLPKRLPTFVRFILELLALAAIAALIIINIHIVRPQLRFDDVMNAAREFFSRIMKQL